MSGLIFLFCAEISLFIISFSLSGRDIMAPSVMMCVMFIISTSVTIINANNWNVNYSTKASLIIITGILTFIVGETLYRLIFCKQKNVNLSKEYTHKITDNIKIWKLNFLIIFDAIIVIWNFSDIVKIVGFSKNISSYFSVYRRLAVVNLAETGYSMTSGILNFLLKIDIASGYLSVFLLVNSILTKERENHKRIRYILIIVLSILPSVMSGGRSGILRIVCAILIEYYIVWHQKNGWNRNLSWKYIKYGIIGLICGIFAFCYSMPLIGRKIPNSIFDYVSGYLGASIQLFDLYIKNPTPRNVVGEESLFSFIKILNYLGLIKTPGFYNLESRFLNRENFSNVYTFFRRPLHDFGLSGMYLFTLIISFFFAWIYFKKIKYKNKSESTPWILLYGYIYYWIPLSSIDQYSQSYLSAGTFMIMSFTYVLYSFVSSSIRCKLI